MSRVISNLNHRFKKEMSLFRGLGDKKVILWDLGGQKSLQRVWKKYYLDSDGLIFVVDGTNTESLCETTMVLSKKCFVLGLTMPRGIT